MNENKEEKVEETIELDEAATKAIADKAAESVKVNVEDIVKQTVEATMKSIETVNKKSINDSADADKADKAETKEMGTIKVKTFDASGGETGEIEVESKFAGESKEMRFLKAARALANGDLIKLNEYNQDAMAIREKANYGNETTDADGAVLIPYPDFDLTIHENLPKYGVAAQYATIRTVVSNQVKQIGLTNELSFVATAEAGVKSGGKLAFNAEVKTLAKFALIVTATDEMTEDAAIDYWGLVTREMARSLAKLQDQIVFTNLSTASGGAGITHTSGVITEPTSGDGTTITWTDILNAENAIEDGIDTSNYKWFMRRETWNYLINLRGTTNDGYLAGSLNTTGGWMPNNNSPATPWGTPIVFTRVLTKASQLPNPGAEAVYGDLSYYTLYTKRGMVVTALREATVKDAGGSDYNLATQDGTALRFVVRLLGFLNSNDASRFVILGRGTVS